jgi:hypothetical protein
MIMLSRKTHVSAQAFALLPYLEYDIIRYSTLGDDRYTLFVPGSDKWIQTFEDTDPDSEIDLKGRDFKDKFLYIKNQVFGMGIFPRKMRLPYVFTG